jgi:aspartyl-tRNA(Asn)/glutamyl-tRNA(Gln) amidotransferase subunit B
MIPPAYRGPSGGSAAAQYRAGQTRVLSFFIGRVMAATEGKANPQMVNKILRAKLDE